MTLVEIAMTKIKVTYAHGVDVCMPWEDELFGDWYEFADWLKKENHSNGPITIIAWEYVDAKTGI